MSWYQSLFGAGYGAQSQQYRQGMGPSSWQSAFKPIPVPSYPEPPKPVSGVADLDEATRKRNKSDMWLSIAAALAEGSQNGQIGSALARAAQATSARRKSSLEEEDARRQAAWQRDVAKVDREGRSTEIQQVNQEREQKAKALFETWQQGQQGIDVRDRSLYRRAASLAETGDLAGLQKLLGEAPGRAALFDKGVNPDDEMQVLLHRQRALDEAQLEGRVKERGVIDPLDIQKQVATRKALSPLEIGQADEEAAARAKYRQDGGGGGGRQLEGRLVQAEDGSWVNVDQTIPGVVMDPRTGRPLKGRKAGESLEDKAVEMTMKEKAEYDKIPPSQRQQAGIFNFKTRVEQNLKQLREAYGAAAPEGEGVPADTGSKEPGARSTAAIVQRVKLVEKALPNLRGDEKQQAMQRITAGEPAAKIVREKAFPGLPQNLWKDVEDDIRSGKSIVQIQQALRLLGTR